MAIDNQSSKDVKSTLTRRIVTITISIKQSAEGERIMDKEQATATREERRHSSDDISRRPAWFQEIYRNNIESGKREWIRERAEKNRKEAEAK